MKPVILVFVRYYLPGFRAGGPIRSIANLVERLGDEFEFRIVALDRDVGDSTPYPNVELNGWVRQSNAFVRYVSPDAFGLRQVAEIVRTTVHDVIYLNSFFDPRFTQQVLINHRLGRLSGRPIVIACRGEFSTGAMRIKLWKKLGFIKLAKLTKLYEGLTWQASSDFEAQDIQRSLSIGQHIGGRLVVSGHVSAAPDTMIAGAAGPLSSASASHLADAPLRVCFLSRINPKKNLDFALSTLADVRAPVRFVIYGPIEDESYWAECETLISKLPPNIEVKLEGAVGHEQVVQTLAQHELFLFPTRGENYGHVIHEALRAGLPLLISDQTPWKNLCERGVGWELPLGDKLEFARRIEQVALWSPAERRAATMRAQSLASEVGDSAAALEAHRQLFKNAIGNRLLAQDYNTANGL